MRSGRILTVPTLVGYPNEKRRLGEQYQALAVDMESAEAARICQEAEIPFTCLRAISDDSRASLSPRLLEVLQEGTVAPGRLAWAVLCQPGLIGELMRLARDTRRAARRLAEALVHQVLAEIGSGGGGTRRTS